MRKGKHMSTDDRTETITDRATIRDSDEPSERGDFPCYDLGSATSETVAALDLDAIEAAALADDGWWSVPAFALVAEVRNLRAKLAAGEALAFSRPMILGDFDIKASALRAALATGAINCSRCGLTHPGEC